MSHMHENQEEPLVVREGRVTFETEGGAVVVDAGERIRFDPGEYQQGVNTGGERVVALVIGAPQDRGVRDLPDACRPW